MKRLVNNKGFTLVEVIITFGILCVVIGIAAGIIVSTGNSYYKDASINFNSQLGNSAYNFIEDNLRTIMHLEIGGRDTAYDELVVIDNGHLKYSNDGGSSYIDVFDESVYNNATLQITTSVSGSYLSLTVDVIRDGEMVFEKSSGFQLENIGEATGAGVTGTLTQTVNPVLNFSHD